MLPQLLNTYQIEDGMLAEYRIASPKAFHELSIRFSKQECPSGLYLATLP
jgi:hypothetical protein